MINILYSEEILDYERYLLLSEFERIKQSHLAVRDPDDIAIVYRIIEEQPSISVLEEIVFSSKKYNILLKHDALLKAIEFNYQRIIDKVLIKSEHFELIKTAIFYTKNNTSLITLVEGGNKALPNTKTQEIQEIALTKIDDHKLFTDVTTKIYSSQRFLEIYRKVRYKASYNGLSTFQKKLLPLFKLFIPHKELKSEFNRTKKYPLKIRKSLMKDL